MKKKLLKMALFVGVAVITFVVGSLVKTAYDFNKGYTVNMREAWRLGAAFTSGYKEQEPNKFLGEYKESFGKALNCIAKYTSIFDSNPSANVQIIDAWYYNLLDRYNVVLDNDDVKKDQQADRERWSNAADAIRGVKAATEIPGTQTVYAPWWTTIQHPLCLLIMALIAIIDVAVTATVIKLKRF